MAPRAVPPRVHRGDGSRKASNDVGYHVVAWAFMALGVLLLDPRPPGHCEAGGQRGISKLAAVDHTGPVSLVGEMAEVDEGMPPRRWEVFVAVLLWAWMALAMGGVAWVGAGEQRWTQYWGQIQSITIDRCGQRPGLCEGTLVLTLRRGREVSLAIRPGMWITREDRLVHLEELRVGDEIHVQAFERAGAGAEQVAQ